MKIPLLEARRREARDHDQIQRQAEERATQVRLKDKPRVLPPARSTPMSGQDQLAELLVRDGRQLATVADLHAVIAYFDERLDELLDDDESL